MSVTRRSTSGLAEAPPFDLRTSAARLGIPYAGWNPNTFNGIDIYSLGFNVRPTLFFDPAAPSGGNGTYLHPFSNETELNAWIAGNGTDMKGQTLGFKRGSLVLGGLDIGPGGNGMYSSDAANPFRMVPYGDADSMPIISAGTVYAETSNAATGWANTAGDTGGDARIWKVALSVEGDVFDQSYDQRVKRLWKTDYTGVTNETTAVAALITAGPGQSIFYGGMLYIYPFYGKPDWTQVEVMQRSQAIRALFASVAVSGNISLCGLNLRGGISGCFEYAPADTGSASAIENLSIIGCVLGQAGTDAAGTYGNHAFFVTGLSDLVRIGGVQVIGNKLYDSLNGTGAYTNVSSAEAYGNQSLDTGVHFELYGSTSNILIHDNYSEGILLIGREGIYSSFHNTGYKIFGRDSSTGVTDSAKNVGNEFYRNVLIHNKNISVQNYGSGTKVYNNFLNGANVAGTFPLVQSNDDATSHTVSLDLQNNILLGTGTSGNCNTVSTGAGTALISKTNTIHNPGGAILSYVAGVSSTTIAGYQTNAGEVAGSLTLDIDPIVAADGYTPTNPAIYNAGTVIPGYSWRDWSGRPMLANGTDTKPAIGAVARS